MDRKGANIVSTTTVNSHSKGCLIVVAAAAAAATTATATATNAFKQQHSYK